MASTWRIRRICVFIVIVLIIMFIYNLPFGPKTLQQPPATTEPYVYVYDESSWKEDKVVEFRELFVIHNFRYLSKPKRTVHTNLLGIILIHSSANNQGMRSAHRQAISSHYLTYLNVRRIFVLGILPKNIENTITQTEINKEQSVHGDILQGNFDDIRQNRIFKHTMGLHWAVDVENRAAKFIIKTDEDIVLDVVAMCKYLNRLSAERNIRDSALLAGKAMVSPKSIYDLVDNWYPPTDDNVELFPHYLSSQFYVTNPYTVRRLLNRAHRERGHMLPLDDIWLTGVLRASLSMPLRRLNDWFAPNIEYMRCCAYDMKDLQLRCKYVVGTNADREMIVEFGRAVRSCSGNKRCTERKPAEALEQTCEAAMEQNVNNVTEDVVAELEALH